MALSSENVERLWAEPWRYELLLLYATGDDPGSVQQETSMRSIQRGLNGRPLHQLILDEGDAC
ncbi:hypothetical protein [Paraburkholderia kirstenboschensis]|uniref:Uncharacterized protein n=1 Tax=Paraburkholderia kirstenboschensis TaxID=1245436 RepID=A0ABZ0EUZ5_9BURK|nr:hypothetical protein [Paraburkholderia kirstenboschensis]WOD20745.1 hypothetical protein RW095_31795 [Paraburkholderia kirstenboschensis]